VTGPICLLLLAAAACAAGGTPAIPTGGEADALVFARLKQAGITPAEVSSDDVFLRRVYLDVIGTLPTPKEAAAFLADRNPDRRALLIDALLARDEYADYWSLKWSDLLRVKAEFPINLWPNAAQAYHHWIVASLRENKPYDRFVREMLTGSGSNFRVPPVNFYRAMQSREPAAIAQTVALSFMGARAEKWPKERLNAMGGFFSQIGYKETGEWKEEIVHFNPAKPAAPAAFPDGTRAKVTAGRDPREVFADWLISSQNPWFARNIVNRIWSWLLGRGIVQEPDDIRPDNPPSNPELLAYLEKELIKSHYDLKHIYRLILNSRTYQLSSIPRSQGAAAEANFAFYPIRRLEAEVLIDALCQITGTTERYTSAIPEPYTYIPEGQRSISLPDGSISSAFLELFGKPPRDTGLESERNNRPAAAQRLHMLNSSQVQQKLESSAKINYAIKNIRDPKQLVTWLYLMILSRYPTEAEFKTIERYSQSGVVKPRDAVIDLAWALINSTEFQYRH
jgi:Protein of unknown function (DUF1553)/Protein of unknown function (DUF1549)